MRAEAQGATSLERAAKQVARERAALGALPEAAQGHALQVGGHMDAQSASQQRLPKQQSLGMPEHTCRQQCGRHLNCVPCSCQTRPASSPVSCALLRCPPQLLRMHLLENVRVRVEAGHIDYVNELRWGALTTAAAESTTLACLLFVPIGAQQL